MFEGSLVESRGLAGSGTVRWTAVGSAAVQGGLAVLLVALPLLRPELLPMLTNAPALVAPEIPKLPKTLPMVQVDHAAVHASDAVSAALGVVRVESVQGMIPGLRPAADGTAPAAATGLRMGDGGAGALAADTGNVGPSVVEAHGKAAEAARVSSGVSSGMLLTPIRPVYPRIAVAAGVQGAVVMEAVISAEGRIESLHVVSGPAMLRGAAMDAVEAARYAPYKLNGEATAVRTTITVNFRLGE